VTDWLGQAKIGPEVSYQATLPDGTVLGPHGALQAIVNFGSSNVDTTVIGATAAGPNGLRGKATAGMTATLPDGITLDLNGSYDGIGAGSYRALEGGAKLTLPLN